MSSKEFPLANTSDLRAGGMKEVSVGETKVLLARVGDRFHAVSATCPHYGAPLVEGVLSGERVVCPWHHACFNRIEHWRTAEQQGRVAARNMAGRNEAFDGVFFFWTRQFDQGLLYVGHATEWDEIIYQGEVSSQDFLAFYVKDGRVLAVAGMNREREMAAAEELMRLDRMPAPAHIKGGGVSLLEVLHNSVLTTD